MQSITTCLYRLVNIFINNWKGLKYNIYNSIKTTVTFVYFHEVNTSQFPSFTDEF